MPLLFSLLGAGSVLLSLVILFRVIQKAIILNKISSNSPKKTTEILYDNINKSEEFIVNGHKYNVFNTIDNDMIIYNVNGLSPLVISNKIPKAKKDKLIIHHIEDEAY